MPDAWHRHSWKRWKLLFVSNGGLWQSEEHFSDVHMSILLCGQEVSPCCCADTTMGELAAGRAAALLLPNEAGCTADFVGCSILLLEGGAGGYVNQGKTIWWAVVIRFTTNFGCAIQECNCYDMTSVSWKHCHAVLLVLVTPLVYSGVSSRFGAQCLSSELCCAVWTVTAAAAASRIFLLPVLSRGAQKSSRQDGLDIMPFLLFRIVKMVILHGIFLFYVAVLA